MLAPHLHSRLFISKSKQAVTIDNRIYAVTLRRGNLRQKVVLYKTSKLSTCHRRAWLEQHVNIVKLENKIGRSYMRHLNQAKGTILLETSNEEEICENFYRNACV